MVCGKLRPAPRHMGKPIVHLSGEVPESRAHGSPGRRVRARPGQAERRADVLSRERCLLRDQTSDLRMQEHRKTRWGRRARGHVPGWMTGCLKPGRSVLIRFRLFQAWKQLDLVC